VAGAGSNQARRPRPDHPAEAGRGRREPRVVLAAGLLRGVAAREESRAAPLALRLGASAGRLAGSPARVAPVRIALPWGSATAARARSSAGVRLPTGCATTAKG